MKIESKYLKIELVGDKITVVYKYGKHKYTHYIEKMEDIENTKEFLKKFNENYGINFYQDIENDKIILEYEKNDISIDYIEIDILD